MANLEAGFLILNEWIPAFRSLTGDECKELLFALIDRQQKGIPVPRYDGQLGIYAQMIEPTIKRRLDGQKGGRKGTTQVPIQGTTIGTAIVTSEAREEEKSKEYNTLSDERVNTHTRTREKKSTFTPPAVEEVREYCDERKNNVDPERFVDHYTANGWRVGKNPMKDWKAAIRNWEKSEGAFARASEERGNGVSAGGSFDTNEFFEAALSRSYSEDAV